MNQEELDKALALLQKYCEQIGEHFDTVQIFVTRETHEHTQGLTSGSGNWYARFGQVVRWISRQRGRDEAEGATDYKTERG